jgi:uncharacterized protein (DUF2252 family)
MLTIDPMDLARRQIAIDRARTARFPHLLAHKTTRMEVSALAILRGAAPLFYELLAAEPRLSGGPPGDGWLVGDAHVENFGAFVVDRHGARKPQPVFDVNDFDDCMLGPLRFDVLRLATSLTLAGRALAASGPSVLEAVRDLVDGWADHLAGDRPMPPVPGPIKALLDKVRGRSRLELLEARTRAVRGRRRFVRGERYADLPAAAARALPAAFARYLESLPEASRPAAEETEILDAAFRIAGTGSLGVLRIAVLTRGKGDPDGAWLFDLKEEGAPAGARLGRVPAGPPTLRVAAGMRACLAATPRLLGTTSLLGLPLLGRRLAPQEDRLDVARLDAADLPRLARTLGALLGNAHRRGRTGRARRWTAAERAGVVARAVWLAGIHEGVYLAYCALTG